MQITDSDIKKFKRLYKKYFGVSLNTKTAKSKLSALVKQMEVTYRPITVNDLEKLNRRI